MKTDDCPAATRATDQNEEVPGLLRRMVHRFLRFLPQGGSLTERVWSDRHRRLRQLLVLHAVGIAIYGTARGFGLVHSAAEGMIPAVAAALAGWPRLGRSSRSAVVSLGLMAASGILVHISGGLIEFHFHFFVMVALVSLYQDWLPFLCAIGFVVLHHGVVGVLDPRAVYNHPAAWAHPWRWAALHGAFIVAMSVASVTAWRFNELQALYDPLTRVPNRELFRDRVQRALQAARRQDRITAILLFDLDGFKKVNDSMGHSAGDRLLAEVAERLLGCVRASDVPCRLGGDEFAILLHEVGGPHDAVRVAERIERILQTPFRLNEREVLVQASVGISVAGGESGGPVTAEQLLRDADVAMYQAKDDPDTSHRVFDPVMHAAALHRLESEADLRGAVERGEFVVHYQPIVQLQTGAVTSVEALVRWMHPLRGMVPPLEFIPLAEETGLIAPLGRWVLKEACREVGSWPTGPDGKPVALSVNLSARQLVDPDLVPAVESILAETGFDPARLLLEITENATVDDNRGALRNLEALQGLGIRIAVDDFGTGYSSLRYLAKLPVDVLKIDRTFVQALGRGAPEGSLVEVIARLAQTWGLGLVAEGIEDADELRKLRAAGCTQGQGFYFGRPVAGAEARLAVEAGTRVVFDPVELPIA